MIYLNTYKKQNCLSALIIRPLQIHSSFIHVHILLIIKTCYTDKNPWAPVIWGLDIWSSHSTTIDSNISFALCNLWGFAILTYLGRRSTIADPQSVKLVRQRISGKVTFFEIAEEICTKEVWTETSYMSHDPWLGANKVFFSFFFFF